MDHACFSGRDCLLLDLNQLAPIRDLYAIGKVNNDFLLSITTTNDLMDTRGIYLILGVQRRRLIGFELELTHPHLGVPVVQSHKFSRYHGRLLISRPH